MTEKSIIFKNTVKKLSYEINFEPACPLIKHMWYCPGNRTLGIAWKYNDIPTESLGDVSPAIWREFNQAPDQEAYYRNNLKYWVAKGDIDDLFDNKKFRDDVISTELTEQLCPQS